MGKITVIGLGPNNIGNITLDSVDWLRQKPLYLRTKVHPAAEAIKKAGIDFISFDDCYENASFEDVYKTIVDELLEKSKNQDIVYAVPGNPLFNEKTVELLIKSGADLTIYPAMSYLDELAVSLKEDLGENTEVLDAYDVINGTYRPSKLKNVVISQCFDKFQAGELKLRLLDIYEDDTKVKIVRQTEAGQEVTTCPLYELDWNNFDHLTTVFIPKQSESYNEFKDIVDVTDALRAPDGCPWDRAQTHESLRRYLLEESAEVLEAIDNGDDINLQEELGDVLFQVLIHAQIAKERGVFDIYDVIETLTQKMIRRHPHVFSNDEVDGVEGAYKKWDEIKNEEKHGASLSQQMKDLPKSLSALLVADKIQSKAKKVGFDWERPEPALEKVLEETDEVKKALENKDGDNLKEEIGDLLFACVNVARLSGFDPEEALRQANKKFISRFENMEQQVENPADLKNLTLDELEELWQAAK